MSTCIAGYKSPIDIAEKIAIYFESNFYHSEPNDVLSTNKIVDSVEKTAALKPSINLLLTLEFTKFKQDLNYFLLTSTPSTCWLH